MKYLYKFQDYITESVDTEKRGLNILVSKKIQNPENIIRQMAKGIDGNPNLKDESKNQKNIVYMAYFYDGKNRLEEIIKVFNQYNELELKKRIKPIQMSGNSFKIADKEFADFLGFSEFVHGEISLQSNKENDSSTEDFVSEKKPMWSGNGIDIYNADSVGKCISYSSGELTGRNRRYPFCIGKPGNYMYKSYRDNKSSTFYFIIDRNRFKKNEDGTLNLDDPLHIVVFDASSIGIQLTDAHNTTGTISEYGKDSKAYVEYLKSKSVPVDKLVNRPKDQKEKEEDELLGKKNENLGWFKKLPFEMKSSYIGRGHLLTNEQFDYVINSEDLLGQYVDTGLQIPEYQVKKLPKQEVKTYIRKRMMAVNELSGMLAYYEFKLLSPEEQEKQLDRIDNGSNLKHFLESAEDKDEIINRLLDRDKFLKGTNMLSLGYLFEFCSKDNLPNLVNKINGDVKKISSEGWGNFDSLFRSIPDDNIDILIDTILSIKNFGNGISNYDMSLYISFFLKKSSNPEKIPEKLGDIWKKHMKYVEGYGLGVVEIEIKQSKTPQKIVKIYGKKIEDSIRNIDSYGVFKLIGYENHNEMVDMLLSYGVSKKIINDGITKNNERYERQIKLLSEKNFTYSTKYKLKYLKFF
jgi:hypothetical protein